MMEITPIQKLSKKINSNTIFIKRDDLLPFSFGGNKYRKALLFFEDIKKTQSDCVVTYGSSSSNHCRVIANMAASLGIPCYIISPHDDKSDKFNKIMVDKLGAFVTHCSVHEVKETIEAKLYQLSYKGYTPYFIQGGGHGDLGTQAYVDVYNEILHYEQQSGIIFDYIFHTSGTGTTQAGLICGKLINKDTKTIVGISNARENPKGKKVVLDSVNSYLSNQNWSEISSGEIIFIDDYILDGYGSYNKQIEDNLKDLLITDGIPLDTTYTGKGFWGMKEYINENAINNKNILFIHTGGTPLFYDFIKRWFS